ncbi:hypothetical protein SO802_010643 [Lithocarpus litseifolius]|uniref:Uncharacterized protein n=1 Tax=Lithocarpus litseifolius TaxID=425828 RepID=A0AAW2DKC8_9ROSI
MAESLVSSLLEQFASITVQEAEQEIRLVIGVDKEVQKLKGNLRTIQAVLDDAEKRQLKEEAVKLWLKGLKDVSYEMDDVLDEWNTAIIKSEIEKQEKAESSPILKRKVCSFIPSSLCCFRQFKKLGLRHDIAHKIKELSGNLDELHEESAEFGFGIYLNRDTEVVARPTTTSLIDVSDIVGRDKDRDDLIRKLLVLGEGSEREKNPYVISLVGMGGIGKTALAQLAYNDDKVKDHFDISMWVCVSELFDCCKVAQAIIQEVEYTSPNITEFGTLMQKVKSLIEGKKFFLILDDVWTEESKEWEPIKFALKCGAQGSKILVTTRNEKVAKMVVSASITNLGKLYEEHCWLTINKIAFDGMDENQREQLEDLGRELANKCKGLPLAAKTLGSLMRDKRSRQQWKNILDNNLWEFEDVQKGLLASLLLSYYELPSAIKRCFLYCAVFPKDYVFSRNDLVYLWMAQGYLDLEQNIEMEIIGEEYFEKLAMCSFFQDFEKGDNDDDKIITCKMHDMVHDFTQLMSTNECFTICVDKELVIDWKSARHLTLELYIETQFPVSIYNAKNLRTLFLRYSRIVLFPLDLFQHLTCLQSLSLEFNSFEKLPNEVEKLKHLRLLNLSRCFNITELPEMMCNLCNLQTLNISSCNQIKKLPQGMGKLIKLRHLLINNCYKLIEPFPKGIGRLSSLRTLEKFIIGGINNIGECKLGELKNLVHLKGSLVIEGLENVTNVQEAENAQLKNKIHLRELSLWFGRPYENRRGENDELVLNAFEPHPELESLWIYGYGGTGYPNWVMSLTILKKLELQSWTKVELLPPLGNQCFLESLVIEGAKSMKKVGIEFLGIESNRKKDEEKGSTSTSFPNLDSLIFEDMKEWEEWDGMGWEKVAFQNQF